VDLSNYADIRSGFDKILKALERADAEIVTRVERGELKPSPSLLGG